MTLGRQIRPYLTTSTIFRSLFDPFEEGQSAVGSLTKYSTVIRAILLYLVSTMTTVSGALRNHLATSGPSEVKTFSCRGIALKLLSRYWRCCKSEDLRRSWGSTTVTFAALDERLTLGEPPKGSLPTSKPCPTWPRLS
jgi:hypothetical protein